MTSLLAPATFPTFAAFAAGPLPVALREAAAVTPFDDFCAEYAAPHGPLRLEGWSGTDGPRGSRARAHTYEAVLRVRGRALTARAAACGPVAALTAMLYERGISVEVNAFHQQRFGARTATFVRGSDHRTSRWAMGLADDPVQSALQAVIACANRLQD